MNKISTFATHITQHDESGRKANLIPLPKTNGCTPGQYTNENNNFSRIILASVCKYNQTQN